MTKGLRRSVNRQSSGGRELSMLRVSIRDVDADRWQRGATAVNLPVLALVSATVGLSIALCCCAAIARATSEFVPGDVVVYRVGTGASELKSSATPVFLDEYTSAGTLVQSVALPTSTNGQNKPLLASGSASSEGLLTLSADSRYLMATGYDTSVGTSKVAETSSTSVPRTVARVSGTDEVDTTTALSDFAEGNNPRSATSSDGTNIWVAGAAGGVRYTTLGSSTSIALNAAEKNVRQVSVVDGQLYTSADPTKAGSLTIATVGSGLPTTASQTITNLPFSSAPAEPYAYALLTLGLGSTPDTLYVADNSASAILKYGLVDNVWVAEGSVAVPSVTGLTANDAGGTVTLYATSSGANSTAGTLYEITDSSGIGGTLSATPTVIATAPANEAFRGLAFAPGTIIGSGAGAPPPPPAPAPTIKTANDGLPAALNDPTNPTLGLSIGDASYEPDELTVTASSSNTEVAPMAGLSVTGEGAERKLTVTPAAVGYSTITLTVQAPDQTTTTTTVTYAVSAYQGDLSDRYYSGAGNASTEIEVGDGYMIAGDDESNVLRLYNQSRSGPAVKTFDFTGVLPDGTSEIDIESSARAGNTLYWMGSLSNSKSGDSDPERDIVFAATISGSGANTELTYLGSYTGLRQDLIAWDEADGNVLGLSASAAEGVPSNEVGGLNVEGLEFAADSTSTAYLAFRAPIEPAGDRARALLVPVTNLPELVNDGNPGTVHATFGTPLEWNLGGLGIREIRKNAENQYLIIAGTADGSNSTFGLYTWDGNPTNQPVLTPTALSAVAEGAWEGIVSIPDPLTDGSRLELVEDNGDSAWYGDGSSSKSGLPAALQKDLGRTFTITLAQQEITWEATAPDAAPIGGSYTLAASASSGLPVTFSVDPSATADACAVSGSTVTFTGPGTCVIDAGQAGDSQYSPAERVSQTIDVVNAPTVTPVISGTLGTGGWYVSNVTVSWEVSSAVPASSCTPGTLSSYTPGTVVTCTSTSAGGSTTNSVTIKLDQTKPTVSFSGDAGTYAITQNVSITCSASDPTLGSGLAQSSCPSVDAPAWSLGLGTHTLSANAIDNAGNTSSASASYTVTVTPSSLCALTTNFVQGSAKYQQLNVLARLVLNAVLSAGCELLTDIGPQLKPSQATAFTGAYEQAVQSLAGSGWLTQAQAGVLKTFVVAL
jgi:hypothetical protein